MNLRRPTINTAGFVACLEDAARVQEALQTPPEPTEAAREAAAIQAYLDKLDRRR